MLEIKFYELDEINDSLLTRVVIVSNYNGRWVYCKHKERDTWEMPGGHIETGETPLEAAKRELYEETGAIEFNLEPICKYSVKNYALLCYAEIKKFDRLPDFEIEKISFLNSEPKNLTYPELHSKLFDKVRKFKGLY